MPLPPPPSQRGEAWPVVVEIEVPSLPGWADVIALAALTLTFTGIAAAFGPLGRLMGIVGATLTGVAPLASLMIRCIYRGEMRRLERWRRGYCVGCSYDLRGNPLTPRCPECGTPTTPWRGRHRFDLG